MTNILNVKNLKLKTMKKSVLICAIAIFALGACKKENTGNVNYTPQTNSQNIEALILNFKDKLDNHLKDGTTYAADSAVWYVEALLNYSYGYATALGCTFETDSVATTVNMGGSNAYTLAQLNDVYEYLEENALENKPEDRYIFAIDVFVSIEGNVTTFSAISGYAKLLPEFKSTDEDDPGYWYWGGDLGMCGPDLGNNIGMDAGDIIEGLVNATAEYDYFTNIEYQAASYTGYSYSSFPFHDDYLLESRLFANSNPNGPTDDFCLSPTHLSFYSGNNGALYIVRDLEPANKEFAYCVIWPYTYTFSDTDHHLITI
jgi:hypothetical protein